MKMPSSVGNKFYCIGGIPLFADYARSLFMICVILVAFFCARWIFLKIKQNVNNRENSIKRTIIYLGSLLIYAVVYTYFFYNYSYTLILSNWYLLVYIIPVIFLLVCLIIGEKKGIFKKSILRSIALIFITLLFMYGLVVDVSGLFDTKTQNVNDNLKTLGGGCGSGIF